MYFVGIDGCTEADQRAAARVEWNFNPDDDSNPYAYGFEVRESNTMDKIVDPTRHQVVYNRDALGTD